MRKVGSSEAVKVAVFVKRAEQQAAHHIIVGKDAKNEERENLGSDVDSGSPQTLLDFIRWAKQKAPAERYALTIWNHGSGWDPLDFDELYSQVKSAGVTPRELGARTALPDRAQPLPADARGRAEQARRRLAGDRLRRRHRPLARHARAGQGAGQGAQGARPPARPARDGRLPDELPRGRLPVRRDVRAVVSWRSSSPATAGPTTRSSPTCARTRGWTAPRSGAWWSSATSSPTRAARDQWPVTMCAVHSAELEPFADTLDAFTMAAAAGDQGRRRRRHPAAARPHAQRALRRRPDRPQDAVRERPLPAVRERGQDRGEEGARRAQARRRRSSSPTPRSARRSSRCGGVTAYLPAPSDEISPYYKDLRFAQRHGWDEFLRSYRRAVRGT